MMLFAAIQAGRMVEVLHVHGMITSFTLGTMATDWTFYWLGRKKGRHYVSRSPEWQKRFRQMESTFQKRGQMLLFTYRFMYGFRLILPVLFGVANVHPLRFALCSLCSTVVWVGCFSVLGYYFAGWALASLQHLLWFVLVIILTGISIAWYRRQKKRSSQAAPES